ncbi:MAG: hypothetical protein CR989_00535 [Flavobacteriales bacterium]|nr:MAG: hypothetical protein CR989_00535 [Flavobacteriales bacterium]
MARITDDNKLSSIKDTMIEIIVRDGSQNASIAKIAKEANVSVGYLYRHYESKEKLIKTLYVDKFQEINEVFLDKTERFQTLKKVIVEFYSDIVKKVNKNDNEILFLLKMMTDYSIKISEKTRTSLREAIRIFKHKFAKEINTQIENEQIFIQVLGNILLFINLRKRGVLNQQKISKKDISWLSNSTINSLK